MDVSKLALKAIHELKAQHRKPERISLTPEAYEEVVKIAYKTFGTTQIKGSLLFGYPISVNPSQTKPVVALQSPEEEWLHKRKEQ